MTARIPTSLHDGRPLSFYNLPNADDEKDVVDEIQLGLWEKVLSHAHGQMEAKHCGIAEKYPQIVAVVGNMLMKPEKAQHQKVTTYMSEQVISDDDAFNLYEFLVRITIILIRDAQILLCDHMFNMEVQCLFHRRKSIKYALQKWGRKGGAPDDEPSDM